MRCYCARSWNYECVPVFTFTSATQVAGFLPIPHGTTIEVPAIVKASFGKVWHCDGFAVAGTGTGIAEAALFHRNQNTFDTFESTVYKVYEAKRLAEKAPLPAFPESMFASVPKRPS